jgi:hypothetical protein
MQARKSKRLYRIVVEFANGVTRTVAVRAVTREVAENKALKFHPNAKGIKHDA